MPGGGDLIHAWDLVFSYHTSPDSVRDATFIKYMYTRGRQKQKISGTCLWCSNARSSLEKSGNSLCSQFQLNSRLDARPQERSVPNLSATRTIILAAVAEAKLTRRNAVGMVYYEAKSADLGPASEVIDVMSIDCLKGRIWDSKRWACLVRPEVTAKSKLVEESSIGDVNE
ncbi:hypothetical protein B0H14DRAFT_2584942 [Mycena olivaceomarginata]|nr:hypothetical protein B0H14DRAFT_2584942 [Mycena olivaceomarginata]